MSRSMLVARPRPASGLFCYTGRWLGFQASGSNMTEMRAKRVLDAKILRCGLKCTITCPPGRVPRLVYASLVASERKLRMTHRELCYPERSEGSVARIHQRT